MSYATERTLRAASFGVVGVAVGHGLCLLLGAVVPGLADGFTWGSAAAGFGASLLASVHSEAQRTAAAVAEIVARGDGAKR